MNLTIADIKNYALMEINHEMIANWDDDTNTDIPIINKQFDLAIREALAMHPWNFAKTYAKIELSEVPAGTNTNPYKYTAEVPNVLCNLAVFYDDKYMNIAGRWWFDGLNLSANKDVLYVSYTDESYTNQPAKLPSYFIDWFKTFLASRINSYLNGDIQREQLLKAEEPLLFRKAKAMDGKIQPNDSLASNPILDARRIWG